MSFGGFAYLWSLAQRQEFPVPQDHMCGWLDAMWEEGKRELLLLAFRGSGKSTIAGLLAAWRLATDPDARVLVLSAELALATKMVRATRQLIAQHPLCRNLRPEPGGQWTAEAFTVARRRPSRDPSMLARGVTGNFTGSHADLIICDDVEVPNTCDSAPKRQDLRERLREIPSVLAPGGTVLYIGTPHTFYSIYAARALPELGEERPFLDGYARFELPLVQADGTSTWPDRIADAEIARIRRRLGPNRFASQMLLAPAPATDGRLDPDRIRPYAAELEIREVGGRTLHRLDGHAPTLSRAWWDPALGAKAAKGERGGDGSVVAVLFLDAAGHAWLHRVTYLTVPAGADDPAAAQCRAVAALLAELGLPAIHLETNGLGGFLPALLRRAIAEAGVRAAVVEVRNTRPKHLRILDAFDARLAAGMLHAHRSVWDTPFIREMREWRPDRPGRDDGLDAVAGCLSQVPARLPGKPAIRDTD